MNLQEKQYFSTLPFQCHNSEILRVLKQITKNQHEIINGSIPIITHLVV